MSTVTVLERRRIEAQLLGAVRSRLAAEVGAERARAILSAAVRDEAERQGRALRAELPGGLAGIQALWERLRAGGALELEVLESTPRHLRLRVTRCRYAELYGELGLTDEGEILSCSRDEPVARGLDGRVRLERAETLLGGAAACVLDYFLEEEETR
jgi:hypothetical protein